MRTCLNCGEENSDRARFCQVCATPLQGEAAPPRDVRKVVTVLFTDVTGSTALGEQLDPESLRHVMGRFFDAMKGAIERHGGVVEKFIGDAVMAVFGIPRLHEDDPVRAVRAAAAMAEALDALNADLQAERGVSLAIRTGITSGEVVAGDPAAGQRLVTGDTVNTAARLEQHAQPGEILLGDPTYRLVRDAVDVEPVEPLSVKGKAEPLRAYRLVQVHAGAEPHARRLDSVLVGRDRELRALREALDRAVSERTSQLFTLLGPAGVGKSRLVLEFLAGASEEATVLRGRCLSYGDDITFYPLAEAVREAAGIGEQDSAETARRKVAEAAGDERSEMVMAGVAQLIGLGQAPVAAEDAFWAVRSLFESLAQDRPLVLVFDDIHWAEPAFLDLIEHVADWTRDAAILLLCVARPELLDLRPGWAGGKLNATSILLEPLGAKQCAELMDNLLGGEGLPPAARSRIFDAAEGNPLFVEEMIAMLIDDGLLRQEDGRWVASQEVALVAVPPTIQLLMAARLDRLDAEERAVAERASVEGKVFHRGAVTRLSPDGDRPAVPGRLLALARKELIRPDRAQFAGDDAFRFRHLLIRDAAYQGMSKQARAELHLRFADWLDEQAGERLPEYEDVLGYHLEQAYRYRVELGPVDEEGRRLAERAGMALASAGRRAADRDDIHAVVGLLTRAADLLPREGAASREVRMDLVHALVDTGEFLGADALLQVLVRDARESGDRRMQALTAAGDMWLGGALHTSIPEQTRLERAREAMQALEAMGDRPGTVRASRTVGFVTFVLGRVDEAVDLIRWRINEARVLGDRLEVARSISALGGGLYFGSTPVADAVAELESLGPSVSMSPVAATQRALQLMALLAMQGKSKQTRAMFGDLRAQLEQIGDRFHLATRVFWTAPMFVLAGDLEAAERELRESVAILESMGEKGFLSTIICELGEVLARQGQLDEAERCAERGHELAAPDDIVSQLEWRTVLAKVYAERGRLEEAERLAREAIALVEPTDYRDHQADCALRLAEVLKIAGRTEESTESARRALERYERKGNEVMAERVRRQLASAS